MSRKKILVDMDGILANLLKQWLEDYNREYEDNLRMQDITTWDMHEHVKPEVGRDVYKIPNRLGYFDKTPPIPGAVAGFRALQRAGHEVVVCSSPYNDDSARAKQAWCARYLNTRWRDVTLTHKKSWFGLAADVIIDDKPSTIKEFHDLGKEVITIAYPYNKSVEQYCALRAQNMMKPQDAWEQIVDHLT